MHNLKFGFHFLYFYTQIFLKDDLSRRISLETFKSCIALQWIAKGLTSRETYNPNPDYTALNTA